MRNRRSSPPAHVVREYGRDSLLVWANLLLAPLLGALGLRVGLRSDAQVTARIETDAARMRGRGYLVTSVQRFTLPGMAGRGTEAHWYRVTFDRTSASPG